MDDQYNIRDIEAKWQQRWAEEKTFRAPDHSDRPKFYGLEFFPYPSGAGLHVGHLKNYIPTDAFYRYQQMRGHNVLHPMGWDAFGLPAENEAIRLGRNPREMVPEYAANYKRTLQRVGASYDWDREINSSQPDFYKWTQWIFLLLYHRALAYRANTPINWCPQCLTGLANEEVKEGRCWRCGTPIEKRPMPQWYFKITAYADRLLADLDTIDWPEGIKQMQRDWIGRSEGAEVDFPIGRWALGVGRSEEASDSLGVRKKRLTPNAQRPTPNAPTTSSASSPRARIRSSAPLSWCWRPSTRSSKS
jgi:leucyl-tRNA synthetase